MNHFLPKHRHGGKIGWFCSGVTLVELMITLAIVAILAALLTVTCIRIRQAGDSAKCASNLRQVGAGLLKYAYDHNGSLVPSKYWYYPSTGNYLMGGNPISGCLDYIGITLPTGANPEALTGTVLTCPAMKKLYPHMNRCYSLNNLSINGPDNPSPNLQSKMNLSSLQHPAKLFMFTDGPTDGSVSGGITFAYSAFSTGQTSLLAAPHRNLQNVVFFDDHVEALPSSTFSQNGTSDFFGSK